MAKVSKQRAASGFNSYIFAVDVILFFYFKEVVDIKCVFKNTLQGCYV